ncbi:hypothetical protein TIFTF001_005817 [Ficus carica]|uniref:MULE transposase domain-containing protein n=1 Tax=Ficus carica TaxID=3494 RepID=A0AA88CZ28_FICCA|nr:hypothetical protein TIFTF001_005817 [Ficus carica]
MVEEYCSSSPSPLAALPTLHQPRSSLDQKWFFEKLRDSIGTRESLAIVADRHKGIEYATNIVYPDADFGICVQHLAANLTMRYKYFYGPMKTYFYGASRTYLISEHQHHMESIWNRNPDMHRYLLQVDPQKMEPQPVDQFEYAVTNRLLRPRL